MRIIVRPEDIDDLAATHLARDIAKKIEETMQYPGQIKVTVIRETRAIDYAKYGFPSFSSPTVDSGPCPDNSRVSSGNVKTWVRMLSRVS